MKVNTYMTEGGQVVIATENGKLYLPGDPRWLDRLAEMLIVMAKVIRFGE